jgi:hypothetical protein
VSPALSATGQYVAFASDASDLVPDDGATEDPKRDIFVRNRMSGATTRQSVDTAGEGADGRSNYPSISGDGRFVAFLSEASDIIPDDEVDNGWDVFLRDRVRHVTTSATEHRFGGAATGTSDIGEGPSLSADGRYVAFTSDAAGLDPNDNNSDFDIYVRAVVEPTVASVSPPSAARGTTANLVVTGTGFLPGAQASFALFSAPGVAVDSVTLVSETELHVTVTVDPGAPAGARITSVWPPGTGPGVLATSFGLCGGCFTVT